MTRMSARVIVQVLLALCLCSASAHAYLQTDEHCQTCVDKMSTLENLFLSNSTMKEIQAALDTLCFTLPQEYRQECRNALESVLGSLQSLDISLVEDYTPQQFCSILGFCQTYCCTTPYDPQEIHISLTDDPSQMAVMWVTQQLADHPTVYYGTSRDSLTLTATGTYHTYTQGGWNGWIYVVTMENLSPNTKYYYQVGDPNWYMSQNVYPFTSAPTNIQPSDTFSFITFGDMGSDNAADPNIYWLSNAAYLHAVDVILHIGDISYADGYQPGWDLMLQKLEPVASQVPYMTCPGNHEEFFDFVAYRNRFQMPVPVPNLTGVSRSNLTMYYSFDYGHAHFVSLSSESYWGRAPNLKPGHAQYEWLASDLASVDRTKTPWLVVYLHRPLYCSSSHKICVQEAPHYRNMIEELLNQYQVDLVLTGHVHNYERTLPVYNSTVSGAYGPTSSSFVKPGAPIYGVIGTGGNHEHPNGSGENEASYSVPSSQFSEWGYTSFKMNSTFLSWNFYRSYDHNLLDSFTISK